MSVYATRQKRPIRVNVKRPVASAAPPGGASVYAVPSAATSSPLKRKAKPTDALLPWSLEWLASLPPTVRPLALATKYPRIVNRIAAAWGEPSSCRANFDDLVYDNRGDRQGFPPDVHRDLMALREYYYGYSPQMVLQA
jgi:hypothetical protein